MENKLLDLALARRSVRSYKSQPIDNNILQEILNVALTAPTSFGHEAVEFVVTRNKETIKKLGACKRLGGSQINSADTVISVIVKTADKRQSEFWIEDGAIASAYILLAAEQYDIGACWVQIRNRMGKDRTSNEEIRELLDIPNGYTVLNLISLGIKNEEKSPYTKESLPLHNIHYETFKD